MAEPNIPRAPMREKIRKRRLRSAAVDPYDMSAYVPDGMTYEWKTMSVLGQEDPGYIRAQMEQGWDIVDASRHPEVFGAEARGAAMHKGLVLMERPCHLTAEARDEDRAAAREQMASKTEAVNNAPPGMFPRTPARIKTSYEPAPSAIPED